MIPISEIIIIIESNDEEYESIAKMINKVDNQRYEAVRVKNLKEITDYLSENHIFHSLFLNLNLDDSTGLDTLLGVKELTDKPIIVYSTEDNIELGYNSLQVGATDFLFMSKINFRLLNFALQKAAEHKLNMDRLYDFQKKVENEVKTKTLKLSRENQMLKSEIQQRKTLDILKAAEKERLAKTLQSIADGVVVTETDGKIISLNKAAQEILGFKQKEALKKKIETIFRITNDEFTKEGELLKNLISQDLPYISPSEIILLTKDDSEKYIQLSIASIKSIGKEISGLIFVFRDQTDKRRVDDEQEKTFRLETVGQMASGLAHEMNNILTMILSNIDFIHFNLEDEQQERLNSYFNEIDYASNRAKNLIEQLMLFTMGGEPAKQKTDIGKLIHELCFKLLNNSDIDYKLDIDSDLEYVEIDISQFSQAFVNVLKNAIEATGDKQLIEILVKNAKDNIEIIVQDYGKGIPRKALNRIFDPYFTLKEGHKGLGLTTAYSIIKSHNGSISVDTQSKKGARIIVKLPILDESRRILADDSSLRLSKDQDVKVLLVDDDVHILKIAEEFMTKLGFELFTAHNVDKAIVVFKEQLSIKPFNILIIDLDLSSSLNGIELKNELEKISTDFKTILVSGHSDDPILEKYEELGFNALLMKPFRIQDLISTIKSLLNLK